MPHNRAREDRPAAPPPSSCRSLVVGFPRDGRGLRRDELRPRAPGLRARDLPARHHHADRRARRVDDRPLRHRAADPDLPVRDPGGRPQRDRRDRGQELLPARRRRRAADGLGARRQPPAGRLRAGRLDADAAARAGDLSLSPEDDLAQGQRGPRGLRDRAALLEGPDPDHVRQRDLPRATATTASRPRAATTSARASGTSRSPRRRCSPGSSSGPRTSRRSATPSWRGRGARRRFGGCARPATSPRPSASRPRRSPCRRRPSLAESIVGPYFCEEIRQYLEKTYGEKDLYRRGLRVESTLDPELQAWSEEALGWGLRQISRRHGFHRPRNLDGRGLPARSSPTWTRRGKASASQEGADAARRRHVGRPPRGAEVRIGKETLPLPERRRARGPGATGRREDPQGRRPRDRDRPESGKDGALDARPRPGAARAGRGAHHRELERRDPRDGRRLRLDAVQVQPRHAGPAPGGLGLQALRLPHGPRAGLHRLPTRSSTARSRSSSTRASRPTVPATTTASSTAS